MSALLRELCASTSANLTLAEAAFLAVLALAAWLLRRRHPAIPAGYTVFLILYITLLRRAPGYDETARLHLKLLPNAGVWAGHLLNMALYVPFGWAMQRGKPRAERTVLAGLALSAGCELLQYATGRGMADVNDVLFNTAGAALGAALSCLLAGYGRRRPRA